MDEKKSYQLLQFAEDHDGYVSVSEAKRFGLAQTYLVMAEEEGQFQKVAKGLYVRKGYPIDPYYILHYRYPRLVFHLRSAAFLYNWIENDDEIKTVKLPRNYMTSGIAGCKCVHASSKDYGLGIGLTLTSCGQFVSITDKERTIVDIVTHQNLFDADSLKAILTCAFHDNIDVERLRFYSQAMGPQLTIALLEKLMR